MAEIGIVGQFAKVPAAACRLNDQVCRCEPPDTCHDTAAGTDPETGPPSGFEAVKLTVPGETETRPTVANVTPLRLPGAPMRKARAWAAPAEQANTVMIVQACLHMMGLAGADGEGCG